jgi:hypothetical protein
MLDLLKVTELARCPCLCAAVLPPKLADAYMNELVLEMPDVPADHTLAVEISEVRVGVLGGACRNFRSMGIRPAW